MITTEKLIEYKEELSTYSTMPIEKAYKIIKSVYTSDIQTESLIKSEITKTFVRISQKKPSNDEKHNKCIKMSRKLIKKWKQYIVLKQKAQDSEEID